eukprot:1146590-Pelagomonas_calceolata.AAC.1
MPGEVFQNDDDDDDDDGSALQVDVGEKSLGMQQYGGTHMQADAVLEASLPFLGPVVHQAPLSPGSGARQEARLCALHQQAVHSQEDDLEASCSCTRRRTNSTDDRGSAVRGEGGRQNGTMFKPGMGHT